MNAMLCLTCTSDNLQLAMNAYLVKQAKERQERETEERMQRQDMMPSAQLNDASKGKAICFLPDSSPDPLEVARRKAALGIALKEQIQLKRANQEQQRASTLMQERFFLDCAEKELRADRKQRQQHKSDVRESLRSEWTKQQRQAGLEKILQDAKNGRLSNAVDDLLQARPKSSASSVAGSCKGSITGRKQLQY
jgi:hypothetical protein